MAGNASFSQTAWADLKPEIQTKEIPPGWSQECGKTFDWWMDKLKDWLHIQNYDTEAARCVALKNRVKGTVQDAIKHVTSDAPGAWDSMIATLILKFSERPYEVATRLYDRAVEYKRTREIPNRTFIAEWQNRHHEAAERAFRLGNTAKTYFFLKQGRYGADQLRWILGPSQGNLSMHADIIQAAFNMPDEIASNVYYSDLENTNALQAYMAQAGMDNWWKEKGPGLQDAWETCSTAAGSSNWDAASSYYGDEWSHCGDDEEPAPVWEMDEEGNSGFWVEVEEEEGDSAFFGDDASDGGETDGDEAACEAYLAGRKFKRTVRRRKGKGKGGSSWFSKPRRSWKFIKTRGHRSNSWRNNKGKNKGGYSGPKGSKAPPMKGWKGKSYWGDGSQDSYGYDGGGYKGKGKKSFGKYGKGSYYAEQPQYQPQYENYYSKAYVVFKNSYLVGKEPSAVRGLLVDPGASINLASRGWTRGYGHMLTHYMRSFNRCASHASAAGISGKSEHAYAQATAPIAVLARRKKTGEWVVLHGSYTCEEMPGETCPALWGLPSIERVGGVLNTKMHNIEITAADNDEYIIDLIRTSSGHLIMPTDRFDLTENIVKNTEMVLLAQVDCNEQVDRVKQHQRALALHGCMEEELDISYGSRKDNSLPLPAAIPTNLGEVTVNFPVLGPKLDTEEVLGLKHDKSESVPQQELSESAFEKLKATIAGCPKCKTISKSSGTKCDFFGQRHAIWECVNCGEQWWDGYGPPQDSEKEVQYEDKSGIIPDNLHENFFCKLTEACKVGVSHGISEIFKAHDAFPPFNKNGRKPPVQDNVSNQLTETNLTPDYKPMSKKFPKWSDDEKEAYVTKLQGMSLGEFYDEKTNVMFFLKEQKVRLLASPNRVLKLLGLATPAPVIESETKLDVMELESSGMVSTESGRNGLKTLHVNYSHGWDFLNTGHLDILERLLVRRRPTILVCHLMRSPWINLPEELPWWIRAFWCEREKRVLSSLAKLVNAQRAAGGVWLMMGSKDREEWNHPTIKQQLLPYAYQQRMQLGDMCRHGLKDKLGKLPIKAPFFLLSSCAMKQTAVSCKGHGGLQHRSLKDVSREHRSVSLTRHFVRSLMADAHQHCLKQKRTVSSDRSERNYLSEHVRSAKSELVYEDCDLARMARGIRTANFNNKLDKVNHEDRSDSLERLETWEQYDTYGAYGKKKSSQRAGNVGRADRQSVSRAAPVAKPVPKPVVLKSGIQIGCFGGCARCKRCAECRKGRCNGKETCGNCRACVNCRNAGVDRHAPQLSRRDASSDALKNLGGSLKGRPKVPKTAAPKKSARSSSAPPSKTSGSKTGSSKRSTSSSAEVLRRPVTFIPPRTRSKTPVNVKSTARSASDMTSEVAGKELTEEDIERYLQDDDATPGAITEEQEIDDMEEMLGAVNPASEEPTKHELQRSKPSENDELRSHILSLVRWAGLDADNTVGMTRFANFPEMSKILDRPSANIVDENVLNDFTMLTPETARTRFRMICGLVANAPKRRRTSAPNLVADKAPWRFSVLMTEDNKIFVERWIKIHGMSAVQDPCEPFRTLKVKYGIFVFAQDRSLLNQFQPKAATSGMTAPRTTSQNPTPQNARTSTSADAGSSTDGPFGETPDEPTGQTAVEAYFPMGLGRLTKWLISAHQSHRLRGLAVLHIKFWHASFEQMKTLLERGGVEMQEEEIKTVIKHCSICNAWGRPAFKPKGRIKHAQVLGEIVQFDFFFLIQREPIGHLLDEATAISITKWCQSRSWEHTYPIFLKWFDRYSFMKQVRSDTEGCVASDQAGVWLARNGVDRDLVGREQHLQKAEKHQDLIQIAMKLTLEEARQEGYTLTRKELLTLATNAKNSTTEFGGFSPLQAVNGRNPDFGGLSPHEPDDTLDQVVVRAMRLRVIAMKAIQEAIYRTRMKRMVRAKQPQVDVKDFSPGMLVDVWAPAGAKSISPWRKKATIVNVGDGKIEYKWQGRILGAAPNHVREHQHAIGFFVFAAAKCEENEDLNVLMTIAENLTLGKMITHGLLITPEGEQLLTEEARSDNLQTMKQARRVGIDFLDLAFVMGVRISCGKKKIPGVTWACNGVLIVWPQGERANMVQVNVDASAYMDVTKLTGLDGTNSCSLLFWNYVSIESHPSSEEDLKKLWNDTDTNYDSTIYDDTIYKNSEYESAQEEEDTVKKVSDNKPKGICRRRSESRSSGSRTRICPSRRGRSSSPQAPSGAGSSNGRAKEIAKIVVAKGIQTRSLSTRPRSSQTPVRVSRASSSQTPPPSLRSSEVQVEPSTRSTGTNAATPIATEPWTSSVTARAIVARALREAGSQTASSSSQQREGEAQTTSTNPVVSRALRHGSTQTMRPVLAMPNTSSGRWRLVSPESTSATQTVTPRTQSSGTQVRPTTSSSSSQVQPSVTTSGTEMEQVQPDVEPTADQEEPGQEPEVMEYVPDNGEAVEQEDEDDDDLGEVQVEIERIVCDILHSNRSAKEKAASPGVLESAASHGLHWDQIPRTKNAALGYNVSFEKQVEVWNPKASIVAFDEEEDQTYFTDAMIESENFLTSCETYDQWAYDECLPCYYTDVRTQEVFKVGNMIELTAQEIQTNWAKCKAAMEKELRSWIAHDACEAVRVTLTNGKVITSRWVIQWKITMDSSGKQVRDIKARLVLRGFMDPQLNDLLKSSGTAKGLTHRLLTSKAVRMAWKIMSWDISTAFLQGISFEAWNRRSGSCMSKPKREVHFKMPTNPTCTATMMYELAPEKFKLLCEEWLENIVFKALKAIYGLADAPALWREALHKTFVEVIGAEQSVYDECLYFCRDKVTGAINLLMSLHIDDVEATGTAYELRRAKRIIEKQYGTVKEQVNRFLHCGREYIQETLRRFEMSQARFCEKIPYVENLGKANKAEDVKPCDKGEHTLFRSGVGALIWLLYTRPDLCALVSALQSKGHAPLKGDLRQLNKVIREAKESKDCRLIYEAFAVGTLLCLRVYPDASFLGRDTSSKHKSQLGWVIVLCPDVPTDNIQVHLIDWASRKGTRITKSTLGCEAQAQTGGVETAIKVAGFLHELDAPHRSSIKELRDKGEAGGFIYPLDVYTDAYSLYQTITLPRPPEPSDQSSLMYLMWLREQRQHKVIRGLGWTSTGDMPSDGLTKHLPGQANLRLLMSGRLLARYSTIYEGQVRDGHKGVAPAKRQRYECSAQFVAALLKVHQNASSLGTVDWWELRF